MTRARSDRSISNARTRVARFCTDHGMSAPILMAPMAGACPPALAAAVIEGGGMGGCGALLMDAEAIVRWAADVRARHDGPFQINLWMPDLPPERDAERERAVADFLTAWGPRPDHLSAEPPVSFADQCDALIKARPAAASSIMGLFPPQMVERLKAEHIPWFATVTSVVEAAEAEAAGADVIVAQGGEAGGHRGAFDADKAAAQTIGLVALVPAICDTVRLPVVATGGIADARGMVAALALGASAVQIGTGLLRTPEASIAPAWAEGIGLARPEDTTVTRAFSGRPGRALRTDYVAATEQPGTPLPLPYPLQRSATASMRANGAQQDDLARLQAWAGQSASLARAAPAAEIVRTIWADVNNASVI